ncbi:DUF2256 domain-containing protein [Pararoseomonas sp. SCSIO 73927]|uniref:DUF2256 domain-containing protein n=1 Tax=Pararoseomonas sp. SCSIO 73927 TaxID=3114537 RepID=UPI0030D166E2
MHRKPHLPEKTCATCGRPFAWRKKWARDWEAVRHCSDACRSGRRAAAKKNEESARTPLAPPGQGG